MENLVNLKKVRENAKQGAYHKEAAGTVQDSQKKLRESEKNLDQIKKETENSLSEEFRSGEPSFDFYEEPSSDEYSSDGEDRGSDLEDFILDDLPVGPELGKKRKSPTRSTSSYPFIPDPAGAPSKATRDLIDLRDQKPPENAFEEVHPMDIPDETDPTPVMPFAVIECTLCANLHDGIDFGTAGCSHSIHKTCFDDPDRDATTCPECQTPFGLFVPLPATSRNFKRLRQQK